MKEPFEVQEFDKITCNPDYRESSEYQYLEESIFNDFVKFIEEFTASDENNDALDCFSIKHVRGPGRIITTKNYVGLIQMKDGNQIQILPKIPLSIGEDCGNKETKRIFLKMLRCMYDFQGKVFNTSNLNIDNMNLYEIFINMFLQEVTHLVKKGLKANYISEEDNLSSLRGKLKIENHITKNSCHKENLYCIFDEYQINRPENKLIKSTLIKLKNITERIENIKSINHLLAYFEFVEPSQNYDSDFQCVSIDRSMKDYELIMQWSKIFLKNKSFTTFSGVSFSRALLFPMEKLFEGYVAKHIRKCFREYDWEIKTQDKGYYLFDAPSRKFALKPDIVIVIDNENSIIMDTKWKNLVNKERENFGISQADMYQMYAYAKKYKTPNIWLLYPLNYEMKNHDSIVFESTDEDNVIVNIFLVDVENIEISLEELKMRIIALESK